MKKVKSIWKTGNALYEAHSNVFCLLSGTTGPASPERMYDNPDYFMVSGGAIVKIND